MKMTAGTARRQGRVSALLPLLDDVRHRLRRGASHLPARRSRQNVNLFLRELLIRCSFGKPMTGRLFPLPMKGLSLARRFRFLLPLVALVIASALGVEDVTPERVN